MKFCGHRGNLETQNTGTDKIDVHEREVVPFHLLSQL